MCGCVVTQTSVLQEGCVCGCGCVVTQTSVLQEGCDCVCGCTDICLAGGL